MAGEAGADFVPLTPAPASPPAAPPPPANTPAAAPASSQGAGGNTQTAPAAGGGGQLPNTQPITTPVAGVQPQPAYQFPPEVLAELRRRDEQIEQYRRQNTQLEPLAAQWQRYQQEQQARQYAEQQKQVQNPFGIQYDANLRNWVRVNDQTGQYEAVPGAPPGAVDQFIRQERALGDAARNFFTNPGQYLQQMVGQQAQQIAQQMVQQHLSQYQDQSFTETFIRDNSNWMVDAGTGRLSPEGQIFQQHVTRLQHMGVKNSKQLAEQAKRDTYFDVMLRQRQQQAQVPPTPADPQAAFLAGAAGLVPATPQVPASPPPPAWPAEMSLDQRLKKAMDAAGIKDSDIGVNHGSA
jgi:hypothetical protein